MSWSKKAIRKVSVGLNVLLALSLAAIVTMWYHNVHYMTATVPIYLQSLLAWAALATGAVTWLSGISWGLLYVFNRAAGKPAPKEKTKDEIMQNYLPVVVDRTLRFMRSFWLAFSLIVLNAVSAWALLHQRPPFLPPGGPIIVTPTVLNLPYTRNQKRIYIVANDGVAVLNERAVEAKAEFILLSNRFIQSRPSCVAVAPAARELFVTDPTTEKMFVVDDTWSVSSFAVGSKPHCVAVSPDERKAYVANEQPAPYGTISVFDIREQKVSHTITNVNCPEDLAVSRDGRRLYVTTQCGGDHDPLLVVDTETDRVTGSIPDVQIGHAPAVSPDGKRLFVSRVDPDPMAKERFLLSVFSTVDLSKQQEVAFDSPIEALSISSSGKYLFVAIGGVVKILNADRIWEQKNQIAACSDSCSLVGVALSETGALYSLTADGHVRFTGLAGILEQGEP